MNKYEYYKYIGPDTIIDGVQLNYNSTHKISVEIQYKTRLIRKDKYNGNHPIREAYNQNNILMEDQLSISQEEVKEYVQNGHGIGIVTSNIEFKNWTEINFSCLLHNNTKRFSDKNLKWFNENFITIQESRDNILNTLI